jgi:ArsR family transcriptional regulator, arsenate/arsenite/antimonite-responsive transcriptional repressor
MKTEAQLFKALADETRLKILWLLMEQKELCVTEFTGVLDITQSRASRHLQTLSRAGLVTGRRDRFCVYYRISTGPGTREGKLLEVLREMLAGQSAAEALRKWFQRWFDPATWQTTQIAKELAKPQSEV